MLEYSRLCLNRTLTGCWKRPRFVSGKINIITMTKEYTLVSNLWSWKHSCTDPKARSVQLWGSRYMHVPYTRIQTKFKIYVDTKMWWLIWFIPLWVALYLYLFQIHSEYGIPACLEVSAFYQLRLVQCWGTCLWSIILSSIATKRFSAVRCLGKPWQHSRRPYVVHNYTAID